MSAFGLGGEHPSLCWTILRLVKRLDRTPDTKGHRQEAASGGRFTMRDL
jgi:hypothetical protein